MAMASPLSPNPPAARTTLRAYLEPVATLTRELREFCNGRLLLLTAHYVFSRSGAERDLDGQPIALVEWQGGVWCENALACQGRHPRLRDASGEER